MRYFSLPYIFTVWDVQHKAIPEYPEVGSFFTKTYRDQILNQILLEQNIYYLGINHLMNCFKYYKLSKNKIFFNCRNSTALKKNHSKLINF